jgi:hypothetical protein
MGLDEIWLDSYVFPHFAPQSIKMLHLNKVNPMFSQAAPYPIRTGKH